MEELKNNKGHKSINGIEEKILDKNKLKTHSELIIEGEQ